MIDRAHQALDALDENVLAALVGRSLLLTTDATPAELGQICALAEVFEAFDRAGIRAPLFPDELSYAVFFDNSTRTKSSWAGSPPSPTSTHS